MQLRRARRRGRYFYGSDPPISETRRAFASLLQTTDGIDPAMVKKLGRPFLTTKGHQGTGLGLWVTMSILERYGGRLRVRSKTGAERHGTVFSIQMPVEMRPQNNQQTLWRAAS